jgi:hypothetical protein
MQLAQQVGAAYASNPKVAAVMAGGSTARGYADRFSDIELGVFWTSPPEPSDRAKVVEALGADLVYLYPYNAREEVWADDFMLGRAASNQPKSGVLIEGINHTVEYMDRVLEDVLLNHQPDELKQNLIAGVLQGVPLAGERQLNNWKERGAHYPPELATVIISQKGQIDHYWRWSMWLERGQNLLMLHQQLSNVQQRLLHVLLALNHEYYFGFKWLDVVLAKLKVAPEAFPSRFKGLYNFGPQNAAEELAHLVEETYDLVEQHAPDVDVKWLRSVFRWQRPIWEEPPPRIEL